MFTFPGFGTAAIHAGQDPEQWEMLQVRYFSSFVVHDDVFHVVQPISLATTYKQFVPGQPKGHAYSRHSNPTRDVLQTNLAALEGAEYCNVYSSGLAASMAVFNLLKVGDRIVCSDDIYGGIQRIILGILGPNRGIEADFVDLTKQEEIEKSFKPNTKMVWLESPSNPTLKVIDIQAVVEAAKASNPHMIVVVDNTFASPFFQRPLTLAADIVVHSCTKYINGHSDVTMGAALTNEEEVHEHLSFQQKAVGATPSPFDCYLANRGLKTLHLRMRTHYENALAIAKFLEANPRVEKVLYPALPSHPQYEIHKKQAKGMSGMMSFYLKGGLEESKMFFEAIKVFTLAESLGGYESLAQLPSLMAHASVPSDVKAKQGITNNLIRLSVGLEDVEDLIADLDNALKQAVPNI